MNLISSSLLFSALTTGVRGALYFDPTKPVYGCIDANGTALYEPAVPQHLADVDTSYVDVTLLLRPMTSHTGNATEMCTLHRWTTNIENKTNGEGYYFPLGRSIPEVPAEVFGE